MVTGQFGLLQCHAKMKGLAELELYQNGHILRQFQHCVAYHLVNDYYNNFKN